MIDKIKTAIIGFFGFIITVFGIIAYFKPDVLDRDDILEDKEKEIDKQIEDKSKPVKAEDLVDDSIEKYWEDL